MGYNHVSKGYKLYNPLAGKLIISRDVTFDEANTWNWSQEEKKFPFPGLWEETEENGSHTTEQNSTSGENEDNPVNSRQVNEETSTRPSR